MRGGGILIEDGLKRGSIMLYTEISQRQFDFVTQEGRSPEEVVQFLRTDFALRKFSDVIKKLYPGEDAEQRLAAHIGDRKVAWNWMHDKNLPTNRESVYRIAFALELDEEAANELLYYIFEEGIHYRDKKELVYAYALKMGGGYGQAENLFSQLQMGDDAKEEAFVQTDIVRYEFQRQKSQEDFITFMFSHQQVFGGVHQTAYQIFMKMLACLELPENERDSYSLERIADCYFRMGMPRGRSMQGMDACQKMLKRYWPGLKRIKNMKNKRESVNRKTLLLLYLITEGIPYHDLGEWEDNSLLFHLRRIDAILDRCNMKRLDPRNPFDFFCIYSLNTDEDKSMTERMEGLVRMFMPDDDGMKE